MKTFIGILLLSFSFLLNAQNAADVLKNIDSEKSSSFQVINTIDSAEVSIEIPKVLISGVNTDGSIEILRNDFPKHLTLSGTINGESTSFEFVNGKANYQFKPAESFDLEVYSTQIKYHSDQSSIPLWLSILPPLIAIFMALIFREVISSLFLGIFFGVFLLSMYHADHTVLSGLWFSLVDVFESFYLHALTKSSHQSVILFSMTIGAMVAVISKNGGMQGIVDRISKYAKSARSGQMVTWFLGVAIFFDDYANTLVVGNTMRPVTDRLKISREKLAYLVDSTAAPIAAIAFVTTWIGAELGYVQGGIDKIAADPTIQPIKEGAYGIFMSSLKFSFYPIFTLLFMLFLILLGKDYGPMLKAERKARARSTDAQLETSDEEISEELEEFQIKDGTKAKAYNAILPVLTVIGVTLFGILYTGFHAAAETLNLPKAASWGEIWNGLSSLPNNPAHSFVERIGSIVGMSDSYVALLWSSLSGLLVALGLTLGQKIMKLSEAMDITIKGYKTMLGAIMILVSAWALADVTEHLHTADFIIGLLGDIPAWSIPFITFILAAVVAFSTGSSWGTMAILYPLMLPAAWKLSLESGMDYDSAMSIFYNVTSCVLAGSVLGDHCSPISDTTILSSLSSSCNHIDHVRTQLPYAAICGVASIVFGTIPTALGMPNWVSFVLGIGVLFLLVKFVFKKVEVQTV
jgi:Na+/H+ antiporter NhaC